MKGENRRRPSELGRDTFIARFGGVYEHSPWVAESVWDAGHIPNEPRSLADAMREIVEAAGRGAQLRLLRAHPDLAGRLAMRGRLTADSRAEQASAGLDNCAPEEFAEYRRLNEAYSTRFGFPFIIAVRGLDRTAILEAFRQRMENDRETEFREALDQVHRIARHRLAAMVEGD